MTFDLQRVLGSKQALRRTLERGPIAEKLKMLDLLKEGALTIGKAALRKTASAETGSSGGQA